MHEQMALPAARAQPRSACGCGLGFAASKGPRSLASIWNGDIEEEFGGSGAGAAGRVEGREGAGGEAIGGGEEGERAKGGAGTVGSETGREKRLIMRERSRIL